MCIRALDYCPPVDITFGDYLRALITADRDLVPDDDRGLPHRVDRGVPAARHLPPGVRSLSAESLCWAGPVGAEAAALQRSAAGGQGPAPGPPRLVADDGPPQGLGADAGRAAGRSTTGCSRRTVRELAARCRARPRADAPLLDRPQQGRPAAVRGPLGAPGAAPGAGRPDAHRPGHRDHPEAARLLDPELAGEGRQGGRSTRRRPHDFWFRGGCTLLVDLDSGAVRYCIGKRITSEARLARQRAFARRHERLAAGHLLRRPPAAGAGRALRHAPPICWRSRSDDR